MNKEKQQKYVKKKIIESFYDFPNPTSIELKDTDVEAIEIVLSLIKEQDKYIKDANDITTEMSNDIKKLTSEIEKKDKQIDLMAEYWNTGLAMCDNCDRIVEKYEENNCKNCIKQYFADLAERKVEDGN